MFNKDFNTFFVEGIGAEIRWGEYPPDEYAPTDIPGLYMHYDRNDGDIFLAGRTEFFEWAENRGKEIIPLYDELARPSVLPPNETQVRFLESHPDVSGELRELYNEGWRRVEFKLYSEGKVSIQMDRNDQHFPDVMLAVFGRLLKSRPDEYPFKVYRPEKYDSYVNSDYVVIQVK